MEKGIPLALLSLLAALACPAADPIQLDSPPPEWQPILAGLAVPGPVTSRFAETRQNPFHRVPKRFSGRMWWDPEIGLSLYYEEPSRLVVNVLPQGVLLGRPDEAMQPLPGSDQQQVMVLFAKLFNWDVGWLSENFTTEGQIQDKDSWQLSLRPVQPDMARQLNRIDLTGGGGLLQRIFLDLRAGRTVEIRLSEQVQGQPISAEDLCKAFPSRHE